MVCGMSEETQKWLKAKLIENFLPLGLAFCFTFALAWDTPGKEVSKPEVEGFGVVQTIAVVVIFFISGMGLKTADMKSAVEKPLAPLYALVAILFITPLMGFVAVEVPFSPTEFRVGLALFCCVPTTLTSGVTLVTQAKGNTALALMLTVGSNVLGVLTVPFLLGAVLDGADAKIDAPALFIKLGVTILGPLILGKALREVHAPVVAFTTRNKVRLSLTNNSALLLMVWMSMSNSASKILDQPFERIVYVVIGGVVLHAIFLVFNYTAATALNLRWPERKAVVLLTSQKTLPVSVTIISYLKESEVGQHGLIAIPCIVGHMSQLFIDAWIATRWQQQAKEEEAAVKAAEAEAEAEGKGADGGPAALPEAGTNGKEAHDGATQVQVELQAPLPVADQSSSLDEITVESTGGGNDVTSANNGADAAPPSL